MEYINNKEVEGIWANGRLSGYCDIKFPDGSTYVGEYRNDKKDGWGHFTSADSKEYEGQWTKGKYDGVGRIVDGNGKQKFGLWVSGDRKKWIKEKEWKKNKPELGVPDEE